MAKNVAQSPLERTSLASLDHKLAMAKRCSHGILFYFLFLKVQHSLFDVFFGNWVFSSRLS